MANNITKHDKLPQIIVIWQAVLRIHTRDESNGPLSATIVYVSVHPILVFMFYLIVYHDLDYNTQVETDKTLHNIILNTIGRVYCQLDM